jgi:hypothetical protein
LVVPVTYTLFDDLRELLIRVFRRAIDGKGPESRSEAEPRVDAFEDDAVSQAGTAGG